MAILIKTDSVVSVVRPANGKKFTLEELQGYVGGSIELTHTHPAEIRDRVGHHVEIKRGSDMWINEDGISLGLPFNEIATLLYVKGHADPIIGDVIIPDAGECA